MHLQCFIPCNVEHAVWELHQRYVERRCCEMFHLQCSSRRDVQEVKTLRCPMLYAVFPPRENDLTENDVGTPFERSVTQKISRSVHFLKLTIPGKRSVITTSLHPCRLSISNCSVTAVIRPCFQGRSLSKQHSVVFVRHTITQWCCVPPYHTISLFEDNNSRSQPSIDLETASIVPYGKIMWIVGFETRLNAKCAELH